MTTDHLEGLWISVQEAVETTPKKRAASRPAPASDDGGEISPGENDDFGDLEGVPVLESSAEAATQETAVAEGVTTPVFIAPPVVAEPEAHPPIAAKDDEPTQDMNLPVTPAAPVVPSPIVPTATKKTVKAGPSVLGFSSGFRPPERPEGLDPPVRSHTIQKSKRRAAQPKSAVAMAMAEGEERQAPADSASSPLSGVEETTLISELREALLVAKRKNAAAAAVVPQDSVESEDWKTRLQKLAQDRRVQIGAAAVIGVLVLGGVLLSVMGGNPEPPPAKPRAQAPARRTVPSRFSEQMNSHGSPEAAAGGEVTGGRTNTPPPAQGRTIVPPPPRTGHPGGEENPYDRREGGNVPPPSGVVDSGRPVPVGKGIVSRMRERQNRGEPSNETAPPPPPEQSAEEPEEFLEDGAEEYDPEAEIEAEAAAGEDAPPLEEAQDEVAPAPLGAEELPDDY